MKEFIFAALPWMMVGIVFLIFVIRSEENSKDENYGSEGMCIGMCLGCAIGSVSGNIAMGTSNGMLIGLVLGSFIKKQLKDNKTKHSS
ncbi:MAG: hypothetical protein ACI4U3_08255 [Traorella sp.]